MLIINIIIIIIFRGGKSIIIMMILGMVWKLMMIEKFKTNKGENLLVVSQQDAGAGHWQTAANDKRN